MPSAPARWAFCTARFIARRKAMRLASWSATPWAMSAASSSGVLISTMLSWILGLPVIVVISVRSSSACAPRRPITMPGRAVWMSTRTLSRVRSISIRLIAADSSLDMIAWRIFQSSVRYFLYSRSLNQRLFHSVVTPRRKP